MRVDLISIIFSLSFAAAELNLIQRWKDWKTTHDKVYESYIEAARRFKIWSSNFAEIQLHNQKHDSGLETTRMGLNQFSDMTDEEFTSKMGGCFKPGGLSSVPDNVQQFQRTSEPVADSKDWRDDNVVTGVKNQGQCGSCWAFGAIGAVESHLAIKKSGKSPASNYADNESLPVSLSEQQLVDCNGAAGNDGCGGGFHWAAFQYIISQGSLPEENYPYISGADGAERNCRNFNNQSVETKLSSYAWVPAGQEDLLKEAVFVHGPVAVAIAIPTNPLSFKNYYRGITSCPGDAELNHAVLVVGYGTEASGEDYWLIKNSYGETWGDEGYFKLRRNAGNQCGIANFAFYPII